MSLTLSTKGVISPSPGLSMATKGVLWRQLEGILQSIIAAGSSLTDIDLLVHRALSAQYAGLSTTSEIELVTGLLIELSAALAAASDSSDIDAIISRAVDSIIAATSQSSDVSLEGVIAVLGLILNPTFEGVTIEREIVHLPYEIKPYP